jgi:predicted Zn finger-like uncharacterized protein
MRLVCPNCDAEYEVDNAAIPLAGRDVQCSNCGHAWFQTHPEVEAEAAEEAAFASSSANVRANIRYGSEPEPEAALAAAEAQDAVVAQAEIAPPAPGEAPASVAMGPDLSIAPPAPGEALGVAEAGMVAVPAVAAAEPVPPAPRNIDESVLAVLREEAAREAAARRAETPALETQTEMPLEPGASRSTRTAGSGLEGAAETVAGPIEILGEEPAAAAVRSRGDRLPAIDEINSTLRATSDRSADVDDDAMASLGPRVRTKGGFGRGFLLVILLGVILLALYVFAPLIGAKVPALTGAAEAYVAGVNAARVLLDDRVRALIGFLHSFNGAQSG